MTLEKCIESILDKQKQVKDLSNEIRGLEENLKELAPFKKGDKVLVDSKYRVYVTDVQLNWREPYYEYKFCKEKKDGTMSGQSAGIYYYKTVELIKRAGE